MVRFPPGLAMPSGLNPFAQMVFKAIQPYGMVVTDQSGAVQIEAEQASDWTAEGNTGPTPIAGRAGMPSKSTRSSQSSLSSLQAVDPPAN